MVDQARNYDIIIVGAGLIGSALAASITKYMDNCRVALIERSPALTNNSPPNQRVVALGKVATTLLKDLDVFDKLGSAFCQPYDRMVIWDENSPGTLAFNAAEYDEEALGHIIDSAQCNQLLQAQLIDADRIDLFFNCQPQTLSTNGEQAVLNTSLGEFNAPLIVAADGGRSWVRRQAKIFANHQSYDQKGIVAHIRTQKSHQNTAWQRFIDTGPLAVLPLADQGGNTNQSSIVWSATMARADQLMALDDALFCEELENAIEARFGEVTLLSERQSFPLSSQKAEQYYKRCVVLVGDAAHSIHPLAGQGANLGFKDIVCLTKLLGTTDVKDVGDLRLLAQYQRVRQADNVQTDRMMSFLHGAYQNNTPWWALVRGVGMNWLSENDFAKGLLAKQAIGL